MKRSTRHWVGALLGLAACSVPGLPGTEVFHLEGQHRELGCSECHTGGLEAEVPETCQGCHEQDRPANHYAGDCGDCHSPVGWDNASIDHERFLTLQGGHDGLSCTACHAEGSFEGLDPACESCHEPDRPSGHFSGGCGTCHPVTRWGDGEFDHRPFFPVPHEGVSACESCHPQPQGTDAFTCIECHEHAQGEMTREHDEVSRFVWESQACLDCHPNGREEDDD